MTLIIAYMLWGLIAGCTIFGAVVLIVAAHDFITRGARQIKQALEDDRR